MKTPKKDSYYALLIGINQYQDSIFPRLKWAKKDADDLFNVLTGELGCFPRENVIKLTDENATTENIQKHLFAHIVKNRTPSDTVLVYYSGHTFQTPYQDKVYIAATDTNHSSILDNPLSGISLTLLYNEIFRKTRAHTVIFILDACYSGAIIPEGFKSGKQESLLIENEYYQEQGKIAIVSSPPNVRSREDDRLQHGVLTYWLLKALIDDENQISNTKGEITLDRVVDYIKEHAPQEQPFGRFGYDFGKIILTCPRPSITLSEQINIKYRSREILDLQDAPPQFYTLKSALECLPESVEKLISFLKEHGSEQVAPQNYALKSLRYLTNAEIALLLKNELDKWSVKAINNDTSVKQTSLINKIISKSLLVILKSNAINKGSIGISVNFDKKDLLVIPVVQNSSPEIIILYGTHLNKFKNTIFAHFIRGFYNASRGFSFSLGYDLNLIEGLIWDYLKSIYQFVPLTIYNRRYNLFTQRLTKMSVLFQPIFYLSITTPYVSSFEALAYDTETNLSPSDLFSTVELWGEKFTLDLDIYFLNKSLETYKEILLQTPGMRRTEDILDISINVYPKSLLRTAYFRALQEIITKEIIPGDKIYLEISEKQPFPKIENNEGIAKNTSITTFREILERYVTSFGVGFAIDDFGVGYSSVERLATLHPGYLKIDRDLLLIDAAYDTIKFIIDFTHNLTSRKYLRLSKIVVEGYDWYTSQNISLNKLYNAGVRYIQGYILDKPRPGELFRLNKNNKQYLISLIKGTNHENH